MLTPQNIQEQEFNKAVFGGYDMGAVDDFLETVSADYTALYKENAVLKGKLKVLVDKVEEYR
ncbi:MAG: DivIVA domain-containing protein, partial [Oscillospiraceae bacterium]|nr:DivIVA domain-containing protein [Oscillospiraceae bacterium]